MMKLSSFERSPRISWETSRSLQERTDRLLSFHLRLSATNPRSLATKGARPIIWLFSTGGLKLGTPTQWNRNSITWRFRERDTLLQSALLFRPQKFYLSSLRIPMRPITARNEFILPIPAYQNSILLLLSANTTARRSIRSPSRLIQTAPLLFLMFNIPIFRSSGAIIAVG